jgi:hypothetical protein
MSNDKTVYALSTMTHLIPKYHYKEDGSRVNEEFNNRSYAKKAYKAYLKGLDFFRYKGDLYTVPKINKQKMQEYLDSVSVEDLMNEDVSNIFNNQEEESNE